MYAGGVVVNNELLQESDLQPNGIDIRVDRVYRIEPSSYAVLGETTRVPAVRKEIFAEKLTIDAKQGPVKVFTLLAQNVYEFETKLEVVIPDNFIGIIHQRSTLSRSGITITSGIWDTGYKGILAGQIHTPIDLMLERNVRIAQFILIPATAIGKYSGIYQNKTTTEALLP